MPDGWGSMITSITKNDTSITKNDNSITKNDGYYGNNN